MIPLLPFLPRPTKTQFCGAVLWHNANMELDLTDVLVVYYFPLTF